MFILRTALRNLNNVGMNYNFAAVTSYSSKDAKKISTILLPCRPQINTRNQPLVVSYRHYAKSKDKKKEKGKTKVAIDENQLSELINLESLKTQMMRSVDTLKDEYVKHLSVRTNAGSIEGIPVELDGEMHTLQELAQIVRKNPKTLVVNMSVFPQAIPAALKAIEKSGMNLNPQQDGTTLFIPVPKVTTEHREQLAKNAKTLFVKCKDAIRDAQNKQVKSLKKKDKLSEDLIRSSEQQVGAIADGYINQAEKIMESKQKELLGKD